MKSSATKQNVSTSTGGIRLTDHDLAIICTIERYRFLPTSMLIRLIKGNEDVIHRHLRKLALAGFINRFKLQHAEKSGEYIYYLDDRKALDLLIARKVATPEQLDFGVLEKHREAAYSNGDGGAGRTLFIEHELMISRMHFMLEKACTMRDDVRLATWRQGSSLHNNVTIGNPGRKLPHRPDAFFSLYFPNAPKAEQWSHFCYEADRGHANSTRMRDKLTAHFEFIVQGKHVELYQIPRIRAVLMETANADDAGAFRSIAEEVCTEAPLFWFTASPILEDVTPQDQRPTPQYLWRPEIVLENIWMMQSVDELVSLST